MAEDAGNKPEALAGVEAAAAAAAQATVADDGSITFKLSKPLEAHGEVHKTLRLREPTGLDIVRSGNPVKINFNATPPEITFDEVKMAGMLATLAGVPPSSISKLAPKDWVTIAWGVAGFFIPDMGQL